jgi:hypothetical protein
MIFYHSSDPVCPFSFFVYPPKTPLFLFQYDND